MNTLLTKIRLEATSAIIQSRNVFWLLLFLTINCADAVLTNRAYAMLESMGLNGKLVEVNPILQPLAGSWLLMLKGLFALIIIVGLNKVANISMKKVLLWASLVLSIVCIWNAKSIGVI